MSPRPRRAVSLRGAARLACLVGVLTAGLVPAVLGAPPAQAAASTITKIQLGTVVQSGNTSVTATLTTASTAGDLLVAALTSNVTNAFSAPTGWVRGPHVTGTLASAEIWYYPGAPAGITSVVFTVTGSTNTDAQLSEWRGAAPAGPLDYSSTATAAAATTLTVGGGSTVAPQELAVTSFFQNASGGPTYTAGTGWTNAGKKTNGNYSQTSDYQLGLAKGTVSETETSNKSGVWAGVIATFEPTCATGSLNVTPPSSFSFAGVTLAGTDTTSTATPAITVDDETNSAAGWNLDATSTLLSTGTYDLPAAATTLTSATSALGTGGCSIATNAVTYPVTIPAGVTAPTAIKVYDAAANTGLGPETVTLHLGLAVPAKTYAGTYSSTWTLTVASGP